MAWWRWRWTWRRSTPGRPTTSPSTSFVGEERERPSQGSSPLTTIKYLEATRANNQGSQPGCLSPGDGRFYISLLVISNGFVFRDTRPSSVKFICFRPSLINLTVCISFLKENKSQKLDGLQLYSNQLDQISQFNSHDIRLLKAGNRNEFIYMYNLNNPRSPEMQFSIPKNLTFCILHYYRYISIFCTLSFSFQTLEQRSWKSCQKVNSIIEHQITEFN